MQAVHILDDQWIMRGYSWIFMDFQASDPTHLRFLAELSKEGKE